MKNKGYIPKTSQNIFKGSIPKSKDFLNKSQWYIENTPWKPKGGKRYENICIYLMYYRYYHVNNTQDEENQGWNVNLFSVEFSNF